MVLAETTRAPTLLCIEAFNRSQYGSIGELLVSTLRAELCAVSAITATAAGTGVRCLESVAGRPRVFALTPEHVASILQVPHTISASPLLSCVFGFPLHRGLWLVGCYGLRVPAQVSCRFQTSCRYVRYRTLMQVPWLLFGSGGAHGQGFHQLGLRNGTGLLVAAARASE